MAYRKRFTGSAKLRIESYKSDKFRTQRQLQNEQREARERPLKDAILCNLCEQFSFNPEAHRESRYALFGLLGMADGSHLLLRLGIGKDSVQIGLSGPAGHLIPLRDRIVQTAGVNPWWKLVRSDREKRFIDPMNAPNLADNIYLPALPIEHLGFELALLAAEQWEPIPGYPKHKRIGRGHPLEIPRNRRAGAA